MGRQDSPRCLRPRADFQDKGKVEKIREEKGNITSQEKFFKLKINIYNGKATFQLY
jgi:hypothetical protein